MSNADQEQTFPMPNAGMLGPIAIIVPVLVIGVAVFLLTRRNTKPADEVAKTARQARRKGGNKTRRLFLTLAINALENDLARRGVIVGLKIARNRS